MRTSADPTPSASVASGVISADVCNSISSCSDCTDAASCGWCLSSSMCKSGSASSAHDGQCLLPSAWVWSNSLCISSSTTPVTSPAPGQAQPAAPLTASFVFRILDFKFSSWTPADTERFRQAIQSLLKSPASTVRVVGVRSGSVVVDTEVSVTSTSQLFSVNRIFTNPTVMQQVPTFGKSMSVVATDSTSTCKVFPTLATCIASSGCGWCLQVASCMPGTNAGDKVPSGSTSTCSGSNWEFSTQSENNNAVEIVTVFCFGVWKYFSITRAQNSVHSTIQRTNQAALQAVASTSPMNSTSEFRSCPMKCLRTEHKSAKAIAAADASSSTWRVADAGT